MRLKCFYMTQHVSLKASQVSSNWMKYTCTDCTSVSEEYQIYTTVDWRSLLVSIRSPRGIKCIIKKREWINWVLRGTPEIQGNLSFATFYLSHVPFFSQVFFFSSSFFFSIPPKAPFSLGSNTWLQEAVLYVRRSWRTQQSVPLAGVLLLLWKSVRRVLGHGLALLLHLLLLQSHRAESHKKEETNLIQVFSHCSVQLCCFPTVF